MKKGLLFILFIYMISIAGANVVINEIMYNPFGSDTNHEWIEIYNNGTETTNLTNWKFFEANTNHALVLGQGNMIIFPGEYIVIAQDNKTFLNDSKNYKGKIIESSFSLNNTGEYIGLKNSSSSIVNGLFYSNLWNRNIEGKSIELINPSLNNNIFANWNASLNINGTPGKQNSIFKIITPITECRKLGYNGCASSNFCALWRDGDQCLAISQVDNINYQCSDITSQIECSKVFSLCEWIPFLNRCNPKSQGYCGNNKTDKYERCDGADLNNKTCQSYGYLGGTLKCVPQCSSYDIFSCTDVIVNKNDYSLI